jgi:uncharacterized protein YjbI with pentapeptide repeats
MLTGDSHAERVFDGEDFARLRTEKVEFTDCTFRRCHLTEARFTSCRFQACTFTECDLSLLQVPDSTFSEVRLVDSKVIGVDWATAS